MGLLTKIFGNTDGGASTSNEPSPAPAAKAPEPPPALPPYTEGDPGSSGIRPALDATAARAREPSRPNGSHRRPEHPRMFLRPTPMVVDPALPGSTRRQQISVRPSSKARELAPARTSASPARAAERGGSRPATGHLEGSAGRDPGAADAASASTRPTLPRPRGVVVVSPVSLTPEELELPPGSRPKMRTLMGLGGAIGEPALAAERRARGERGATDAPANAAATPSEPAGVAALDAAPGEHVTSARELDHAVRLLADFGAKLSLGAISGQWVSAAWRPALRRAAELLGLGLPGGADLSAALGRWATLLDEQAPCSDRAIEGAARERILDQLQRIIGLVPAPPPPLRDLAGDARRREVRVIRELLMAVDGTRRDQRARIEEQLRLEELVQMTAEALAEELGAPVERARELRRAIDEYWMRRRGAAPDVGNRLALRNALLELVRAARRFEDCDPEQKDAQRLARDERRAALSRVHLLLAEAGEHDWLEQLEPLSSSERLERLAQWLSEGPGELAEEGGGGEAGALARAAGGGQGPAFG